MRTKTEALRRAKEVKARLKTNGWKISVWENLGWWWSLDHLDGHLTLRECERTGKFSTLFSSGVHPHAGSMNWFVNQHFKDPNEAVAVQIQTARNYVKETTAWVDNLKKVS